MHGNNSPFVAAIEIAGVWLANALGWFLGPTVTPAQALMTVLQLVALTATIVFTVLRIRALRREDRP